MNINLSLLEKAFTDPTLGRIFLLIVVVGGIALADQQAGFTHHYDLNRQLGELERLQDLALEDSAVKARVDSLHMSVLEDMESRGRQEGIGVPRTEVKQLVASIIPVLLLVVLGLVVLDDDEMGGSKYDASTGWSAVFVFAMCGSTYAIGMSQTDVESTTLTAAWVVLNQIMWVMLFVMLPAVMTWFDERVVERVKRFFRDGDDSG